MHQQTYCHTLLQPFSKIFLFRIYAPTIHSTDIEFDETSDRHPHIHAPIQPPQTNPPTTTDTRPYTHATDTTSIQPHKRTTATPIHPPQSTNDTVHTYQHSTNTTHTASTNSLHKHTPTRRSPGPPTQTLTPSHRRCDAAPIESQPRCTRSHAPVRNWTGQADRIRLNQTRPD